MRICLVPLKTELRQPEHNFKQFIVRLDLLILQAPDLVCLPECTLTGYLYHEDDFTRFAEHIPGPTTLEMASLARCNNIHLCFGLLESSAEGIYITAILMDRTGAILGTHRKMVEKPPFLNGSQVASITTEFGKLGLLIYRDLFDEAIIRQVDPSWRLLVIPMSRSFNGQSPDLQRWENEEWQVYLEAARRVGVPSVLINALDIGSASGAFGGAMVVRADGTLAAESPHGGDDALIYDLE